MINFKPKWLFKSKAQLDLALKELEQLQSKAALLDEQNTAKLIQLVAVQNKLEELESEKSDLSQSWQLRFNQVESEKEALLAQSLLLNEEYGQLKNQVFNLESEKLAESKKSQDLMEELREENELILSQMFQLQEELEELFINKEKIAQELSFSNEKIGLEGDLIKKRWLRLEKRIPSYIDWGSIQITAYSQKSAQTKITWQALDCYQAGHAYPEIQFDILIQEGVAGIAVQFGDEGQYTLYPQKLLPGSKGLETFLQLSGSHWRHLYACISVLDQAIDQNWQGIILTRDFDPNFWQGPLNNLIKSFKKLPSGLRYDQVLLKSELQHIDYEHLWLEIRGIQLGNQFIPRIEMRLGAANLDPQGFSRYPKFEFPLVDEQKPFESWYSESEDSFGPKYELRFDLNKKNLDFATLKKLSLTDQNLAINLIQLAPQFLSELMAAKVSINRPWLNWIGLAREVIETLDWLRSLPK